MDASPASELLRNFVSFNRAHPANKATPSLRIMIVDSNQVAATKVHSLLLSERGDCDDEIKRVNHGLEALVVAEQFQPELVIMHVGFPRRSGACTAKLLRKRPWANRLVIVSHASNEETSGERSTDFDFHFSHGIEVALLTQIYKNLMQRRNGKRGQVSFSGVIAEPLQCR